MLQIASLFHIKYLTSAIEEKENKWLRCKDRSTYHTGKKM